MIDEHLEATSTKSKFANGNLWLRSMLTVLWEQFYELWDARNKFVHEEDERAMSSLLQRNLRYKLLELHGQRSAMMESDRSILLGTDSESDATAIEEFLENSNASHVQNWIRSRVTLIKKSVSNAAKSSRMNVRRITTYFRRMVSVTSREERHIQRLHEPPDRVAPPPRRVGRQDTLSRFVQRRESDSS